MAAFDFPNSPNTNDTYTDNGITWIWNGTVWKKDPSSGVKGGKGQKGQKGESVKGQKGQPQKGQKGQTGADNSTKGQKGESVKGQKGEIEKGQKGEPQKGQKGQPGADNSTKGQKGEPVKGQKGEPQKGQKGEPSSQAGPPGPAGSNTFLNLSDVDPSSYSSQAGKTVKVNSGETGLEFTSFPSTPSASVPSGSVMVFYQASAPTGWTKSTSNNNKALRVVSGSGGGTGGNNSFTSTFENKSISVSGSGTASISISVSGTTGTIPSKNIGHLNVVTDQHASVLADLPSHNHQYHAPIGSSGGQYGFMDTGNSGSSGQPNVNSKGSNGSHHHAIYLHPLGSHDHSGATFSGSGSDSDTVSVSSSGTVDLRVQYIDVIICSKN